MTGIVLDTNVLISAVLFGGIPRTILQKVIAGDLQASISAPMPEELLGVLCGRKFNYPSEVAASIVRELSMLCKVVVPQRSIDVVSSDPDDNRVLECAIEAKAHYIVSGDGHLLKMKAFEDISILSPAQFLDLIEKASGRNRP